VKILRNPLRYGAIGTISDNARVRPLGVACSECATEVQYSLTTFHEGFPEIKCPGCKRVGYLMRGAREGGRLIWFRKNSIKSY
jgi:ribosomal protein S27E